MASLVNVTALRVGKSAIGTGTAAPTNYPAIQSRRPLYLGSGDRRLAEKKLIGLIGGKRKMEAVKAMVAGGGGGGEGVAKYKGTQRREKELTEMIEKKVQEAKEVCEGDERSDECKVAWDEVEEVSQAKAHLRLKLKLDKLDPLESFCQDNPETDECRIYED
ncbi:calvin cycle protein CP12-3, chloroplastic [Diospyros lotus]|uniref:calvin cycle protein CP12-3, chloroplastic n=1 Tax=Diospyros lotus TaxID=55363 RepID=UPI00225563EF|nr:calvin cycle protein CP12-3, chloroplastic [Diospyros lotus]